MDREYVTKNGYAFAEISENDKIEINFDTNPKLIKCSNRVRANTDKAAVMRGPFVYCIEEYDNGSNLQMLRLDSEKPLSFKDGYVYAQGMREKPDDNLYSTYSKSEEEECTLKLIPYYKWGNRGENEMCVYIRVK